MATLGLAPDPYQPPTPLRPDDRPGPRGVASTAFGLPGYGTNILDDPLFQQLRAQVGAQNQAAQGTANTGFGQTLANFGEIPDLAAAAGQLGLDKTNPLYGILFGAASNPNIVSSAKSLTDQGLSTEGQLAQAHQTAVQTLLNSLAARGAVNSGDTGVGLRLADQANAQAEYGAHQQLLQNLGNIINAYNQSQQQGINQLQQGASQAAARQIAINPAVPASLASSVASMLTAPITGVSPTG